MHNIYSFRNVKYLKILIVYLVSKVKMIVFCCSLFTWITRDKIQVNRSTSNNKVQRMLENSEYLP